MKTDEFFDTPRDASLVKTKIVSDYFPTWAQIILGQVRKTPGGKLGYVDLYAGPGEYDDGTPSTPVVVLERTIAHEELRERLVSVFNDKDPENVELLKVAVSVLPDVDTLTHPPDYYNLPIEGDIGEILTKMAGIPSLFFIDPWGYKGLTLELIRKAIRDWASECLFFFNYNRINAALTNPAVGHHIQWLFGKDRLDALRAELPSLSLPEDREEAVVKEMTAALRSAGGNYVVSFRFRSSTGRKTTHYLFFVTKHPKGYEVMKDIMGRKSSAHHQSVPSFEYDPAQKDDATLFELFHPLDDLKAQLLDTFAGQTLSMLDVFLRHSVGTDYVKANYKTALAELADAGCIRADHPRGKRRPGSFADDVKAEFPPKEP